MLSFAAHCRSGESEPAQPYEKIRYPTFAHGRLKTLLEADQAEAYDVAAGTPRVNLKNVVITIYDDSEGSLANTPGDQPLPAKMIITSDRGYFTRRPPESGAAPEEVANLEGNVILRQMRVNPKPPSPTLRPRRLDPAIETEIRCHHAQWNNTLRKLNGDGEVLFLQEDSSISGTGFLYLADDEALESGLSGSDVKDWGGITFIEHNARMEIYPEGPGNDEALIEITCVDTASYKLREREIQFEREVKVRQRGLTMDADILKVFLRLEDEPVPESAAEEGNGALAAGQVKSIVATIGKRPGAVIVTGFDSGQPESSPLFTARGGRADFNLDLNRITLTDSRTDQVPRIDFGRDRISDRTLELIFSRSTPDQGAASAGAAGSGSPRGADAVMLQSLNASGGQGQVYFRPRQPDADGDSRVEAAKPTEITYKGGMDYSRDEGRIRFRDSVFLLHDNVRIRAENLDVRLVRAPGSDYPDTLQRVVAETDVSINTVDREARAQRAEYDLAAGAASGTGETLDVLRLFGPPQGTPPHPWVRDSDGNQISAPVIHMQRLQTAPGGRPRHLLHGTGGTCVAEFRTEMGKVISIACEQAMEYDESKGLAWFAGRVMATSDAPEDNYVMTSDRLDIYMVERPNPDASDKYIVLLRRIDASGNARMMQDSRICEANQIIRDFPTERVDEGDIYLEGAPAQGDSPPRMAVYREQIGAEVGAMFAAPRIMASAKGDLIRANGPGQLSMPDEIPGFRSEIVFGGAARYESFHDGMASEAKFRRDVMLRQPSKKLEVAADEMDARFMRDGPAPTRPEDRDDIDIERIGNLRRVEARNSVRVDYADARNMRTMAVSDAGVVEFTDTGNVLTMSAASVAGQSERRWVYIRRADGLSLRSPQIEVRELQGITRAAGPGDLQVPGDGSGEGMSKSPTRVIYGERGAMVYNELAMNIKVSDDVRIVQPGLGGDWTLPSLDGRCDRLEITLLEPPATGMSGEDALSRMLRMDALGGVLIRVYADPPENNPNIDWLNRPGNTFFIRGDQGAYEVPEGRIAVFGLPGRQPQLLLNMVDDGSPPRRQRLKADRFILNTNAMPRRWYFEGQLESSTLRDGEPFEFQD